MTSNLESHQKTVDELDAPLYCDCGNTAVIECKICGAPTCGSSCNHRPCYELEELYKKEELRYIREILNGG